MLLAGILLSPGLLQITLGQETNTLSQAPPTAEQKASDDTLRSFLQVQEQLRNLQSMIESSRQEAAAAAAHDSNALSGRLLAIEHALASQRDRELDAIQNSNRVMLIVAGAFVGVGFLAMIFIAWFQWRTINRLAEMSSMIPSGPKLLGAGGLQVSDADLLAGPALQSNQRLLGNLERLEKRILELEHSARSAAADAQASQSTAENVTAKSNDQQEQDAATIEVLLAKGQSLLAMDKAEEALATFDEAVQLQPQNTDALLKRAAALERLGKLQEALESCDRAITADPSVTLAYLQKGGLFNRLQRFQDALECYEAALRTRS